MCIRDSIYYSGIFNAPFFGISTVDFDPSASVNNLVAASTVCLLYTSDAADERSSVDLGGRRIIKKKKRLT